MAALQKPSSSEVQNLIKRAKGNDRRLTQLVSALNSQRSDVDSAVKGIMDGELREILSGIPVDELNREKKGIRITTLKNEGYESILDVLDASEKDLEDIDGISLAGAKLIKEIAAEIYSQAASKVNIRLSVDDRNADSGKLVRALGNASKNKNLYAKAMMLYSSSHSAVTKYTADAQAASGLFGWAFATEEKKKAAVNAVSALKNFAGTDFERRIADLLSAYSNETVTESEAWDEFGKNPASFYALLEDINGNVNANITGEYGLPEEIAKEVAAVEADFSGLKCTLRKYQEFGTRFFLNQGTVLLGDEMGLGKTVQAIAAMVALRNAGESRFLVVCPASVLINWCREIGQHSDLKAIKIHGDTSGFSEWYSKGGVAVTTYEMLGKFGFPEGFTYAMLTVDEAHYAKNPEAQRTRNLLRIRANAKRVLYMTGTPLENNVDEMCFLIGSLDEKVGDRIKRLKSVSNAESFRQAVAPVYFRRTREDVLTELPDKTESEEWCELLEEEKEAYRQTVRAKNFMGMRQVSWNAPDISRSSKAIRMTEICNEAKSEGRKVIVFTFFTNTAEQAMKLLGERAYGPINGSVSPDRRQKIIDEFTAAPEGAVLVAQIQAGGTGLNIQAASVVIICEPQIKPSLETQAISRAYRMGQLRKVLVYRLLCEGTVDERITKILAEKQNIFDSFADESVSGKESLEQASLAVDEIINAELESLPENCYNKIQEK